MGKEQSRVEASRRLLRGGLVTLLAEDLLG